jgi:hypothetical protein
MVVFAWQIKHNYLSGSRVVANDAKPKSFTRFLIFHPFSAAAPLDALATRRPLRRNTTSVADMRKSVLTPLSGEPTAQNSRILTWLCRASLAPFGQSRDFFSFPKVFAHFDDSISMRFGAIGYFCPLHER